MARGTASPRRFPSRLSRVALASPRRVLEHRELGRPRDGWTSDAVLQRGRFCNIDRRDDAVTRELLREWKQRSGWTVEQKVVLCSALRFTSSRRGGAQQIAGLVDQQTEVKAEGSDASARGAAVSARKAEASNARASGADSALTAALPALTAASCGLPARP